MNAGLIPTQVVVLVVLAAGGLAIYPPRAIADTDAVGLRARDLAVVINLADPLSRAIGDYYARQRGIPPQNIAHVIFDPHRAEIPAAEFAALKSSVDAQLPGSIQAYALTWARPWRVDCMSMTSAFALGYDAAYCAHGCVATGLSRYYNSSAGRPWDELQIRPTMSLAAESLKDAEDLIDRGVSADGTSPKASAYLLISGDPARDVRATLYPDAVRIADGRVHVQILNGAALHDRKDVLFYFIGATAVTDIESNTFLPGAVADHLTSYGGILLGPSSQMSSLRWLQMGATGSYGAVVEPCNFTTKFPNPGLLMAHYLHGETLIEAYWKSVAMPGQGIFIGEPLAAPFRARLAQRRARTGVPASAVASVDAAGVVDP